VSYVPLPVVSASIRILVDLCPIILAFVPSLPVMRISPVTLLEESIASVVGVLITTEPPFLEDEMVPAMFKLADEPFSETVMLNPVKEKESALEVPRKFGIASVKVRTVALEVVTPMVMIPSRASVPTVKLLNFIVKEAEPDVERLPL
jgi:hypothetical protein